MMLPFWKRRPGVLRLRNLLDGSPVSKSSKDTFREVDEETLDEDELDEVDLESIDYSGIKKSNKAKNVFGGDLKKNQINREKTHLPDFASMTSIGRNTRTQDSMNRPYDEDFVLGKAFKEGKLSDFLFNDDSEYLSMQKPRLDHQMRKSLDALGSRFGGFSKMLTEVRDEIEEEFELDIEDNNDE